MKTPGLTCAVSCALASIFATPSTAEDFSATVVTGHPPIFRWVKMIPEAFEPAVQAALEGTEHSMTFTNQFGGAIAGVGEELETIGVGLAELGTCQALFDPSKLAVQTVTYYAPFVSSDLSIVSSVVNDLHRNEPAMTQGYEDNDVTYIGAPIVIDDYLIMTNFPVNSLADLEGRKIAAPGAAVNWLSGTGAVGVSGNLTTYYNELQTGVYDGVIVFASAALPLKLYEVAPYVTRFGLGAQFAGSLCANKGWFDGLPEEVQSALNEGADAAGAWYVDALEEAVVGALAGMEEAGATITVASGETRQAWADNMENAALVWANELDAQGKPALEILTTYIEAAIDAGASPLRNWSEE